MVVDSLKTILSFYLSCQQSCERGKNRKITTLTGDPRADAEIIASAPGNSFSLFVNLVGYKLRPA